MLSLLALVLSAAPDVNLLSLEAGGVAVETPPTWGGAWSVEAMVDGSASTGWCSASGAKGPFRFVFELEQRSLVTSVEVDDRSTQEGSYPGISARALEVWVSSAGPTEGFTLAAKLPVPKAGTASATLPKETYARWVRLVVPGNWGDAQYTELMEVSVRGHGLEPSPRRPPLGTWALEHGTVLRLSDEAGAVNGCEVRTAGDRDVWLMRGETRGRVTAFTWRDVAAGSAGTSVVVVRDDGTLRGSWRTDGGGSGAWVGRKLGPGPELDCRAAAEEVRVLRRLEASRFGTPLTGVGFEGDELRLEPQSELATLRRLLLADKDLRARVLVLGRASEPAPDELERAERRAQKVLQYLQTGGVPASAVDVGFGLLRLGSAVQVEPRVEVALLHSSGL